MKINFRNFIKDAAVNKLEVDIWQYIEKTSKKNTLFINSVYARTIFKWTKVMNNILIMLGSRMSENIQIRIKK